MKRVRDFELKDFIDVQSEYRVTVNEMIELFRSEIKTLKHNGADEEKLEKFFEKFTYDIDDVHLNDFLYDMLLEIKR